MQNEQLYQLQKRRRHSSFRFYLFLIFIVAFLFFLKSKILYFPIVKGTSMENTLQDKDITICFRVHHQEDVHRFDIITATVYNIPTTTSAGENLDIVKRVIGLPGETVQILKDGSILINGKKIEEPYGKEPIQNPGLAIQPITLESDEYFVLGDNRNNSMDSRFKEVGNLRFSQLDGKIIYYHHLKKSIINN